MKYNIVFIGLIMVFMTQSCNSQDKNIDKVIDKFDEADFSNLLGMSVYFRSRGNSENSNIYFVNEYRGACSPYVVEVNMKDLSIVDINNDLVLKSCDKDYLNKEKIESVIQEFLKYDLYLVQVDKEGNVYINPSKQEPPTLLRKSEGSSIENEDQFKKYKGNWYTRK